MQACTLGGERMPLKMSGRMMGMMTISSTHFFAKARPAMSAHSTLPAVPTHTYADACSRSHAHAHAHAYQSASGNHAIISARIVGPVLRKENSRVSARVTQGMHVHVHTPVRMSHTGHTRR